MNIVSLILSGFVVHILNSLVLFKDLEVSNVFGYLAFVSFK